MNFKNFKLNLSNKNKDLIPQTINKIEFKDVSFSYNKEKSFSDCNIHPCGIVKKLSIIIDIEK